VEAAVASSAERKRTLIFFSWIDDLEVCSMCDHYSFAVSHVPRRPTSRTYQRSHIRKLLVGRDKYRLYKELVAALRVWRRVFLHGLEKDYAHVSASYPTRYTLGGCRTLDFNIFAGFNATAVWPYTVSVGYNISRCATIEDSVRRTALVRWS
jgi:hypothetical protein